MTLSYCTSCARALLFFTVSACSATYPSGGSFEDGSAGSKGSTAGSGSATGGRGSEPRAIRDGGAGGKGSGGMAGIGGSAGVAGRSGSGGSFGSGGAAGSIAGSGGMAGSAAGSGGTNDDRPRFVLSSQSLSFSGTNGDTLTPQTLQLMVSPSVSVEWSASVGAAWLHVDKLMGSMPEALVVSVDPAQGTLASGTYHSTIVFSGTTLGSPIEATLDVTLTLIKPVLSISSSSLLLGGEKGRDLSPKVVQLSLNTGSRSYSWMVSGGDAFIQLDKTSGTASASPSSVSVTPDETHAAPGTQNTALLFTAVVNGDAVTAALDITFNLDTHRLLASDDGVALASTPTLAKLTKNVAITDNFGQDTTWSASSDAAWLNVTASGHAGDALTISADPTGLAPDQVYYATVKVEAPGSVAISDETIRVGLWLGSTTPQARTSVAVPFSDVVTDPIRPYAYVHDGGTAITVYNVYTAAVVTTIASVAPRLASMACTADGSKLFVVDATNYKVVPIDLDTFAVGLPWSLNVSSAAPLLEATRTNGTGLLLCGTGEIHSTETGLLYDANFASGYSANQIVATSQTGSRFCTLGLGASASTLQCSSLDYSAVNGGQVLVGAGTGIPVGSGQDLGDNAQDVAVSGDGTRVYAAFGAPYVFNAFDVATMSLVQTLPGDAYPNNIETADDGTVIAGAAVYYGPKDVWVYDPTGLLLGDYYLSADSTTLLPRQLKVSGDSLRIVALTNDPTLTFMTTP